MDCYAKKSRRGNFEEAGDEGGGPKLADPLPPSANPD